jgi:RNA polymerase sporulation-specific sigma factor
MANLHVREYSQLKKVVNTYINSHPIPTRADNDRDLNELARLRSLSDNTSKVAYKKLRDRIILCNGGFGMKYVLKYYNVLNDEQVVGELFQESIIGIAEAIDAFNVKLEIAFTTYAFYHVRKRIIDFIKKNKIVKAPRDIAKNLKIVSDVIETITAEKCRRPDILEIKKNLKKTYNIELDLSVIEDIILLLELTSRSSNDNAFIVEYSEQYNDLPETSIVTLMKSNILDELKELDKRTQKQLRLRFGLDGLPHSIEEINVLLEDFISE